MNICILGGTFDPVHRGHLVVAGVVAERLQPAEVVFIPAGEPWLKSRRPVTPAADRLAMVRLAVDALPGMSVSTVEIERPGPSYTVDTLRRIKGELEPGDELFFILGWDNLLDLPRWHEPQELISLCKLVAVPRIGRRVPDAATLEATLPGLPERVILLDKPEIDISATVIRDRVRLGLSIDHLVPHEVAAYILQHNLYREAA
jgi:nicotinate-nucleotide adenylyltransferase